jgi:hypothetical protein
MQKKDQWLFIFYLWLFAFNILREIFFFFWPESPANLYYYILRHFDETFLIDYYTHIIHLILDAAICWTIYGYTYGKKFLDAEFWRIIFVLRLTFEITANTFYQNYIISLYHASPRICITVLLLHLIMLAPSYVISYHYAFKKN